jgi:chromosome segregation ATPase
MKRLKNLVSPRAQTNTMTPTSGRQASKSSLASRPPLTIRVSTSPPPKEPVDVLKEQVSSLAERVSLLDKENIVEDENLGEEFRHVNEQLQEIQNRLSCLDEERKTFLTNTAILETEKRNIQEQLFIREREVQTLVRRCQSQEEKMRESAKLRVSNSNLSLQLEGLKTSLSMKEEEISQVENLQQELKECKEARDEMRSRWEKVKKDHNDVVDTLNSCFLNMQKMQDKLQEHDDERRRESQRAEVLLEKQRLVHQELENDGSYSSRQHGHHDRITP